MPAMTASRTLILAATLGCLAVACSGTSTETSSGGASGTSASFGARGAPADCIGTCTAQASRCQQDAARCSQLCGSITSVQAACIQSAECDEDKAAECLKSGSSGGTSGGGTSGTSGARACIELGGGGCGSLNAPSNCCALADRPEIVCNGNNDGKGNAQCCVNVGKACRESSDCCGNASSPTTFKCCPTGKCGTGC